MRWVNPATNNIVVDFHYLADDDRATFTGDRLIVPSAVSGDIVTYRAKLVSKTICEPWRYDS